MEPEWKTKQTDRFILRWIKNTLSSRITQKLVLYPPLRPWMFTLFSMVTGVIAGALFAFNLPFLAGLVAFSSQILDGVDGQFARLTGRVTSFGAFLDSVLDRYSDGCLVIGLVIFCLRNVSELSISATISIGALALIGSGLISYTSSRAENLGIILGKPTLASKGTRTTIIAISGLLGPISCLIPLIALIYLVVHTNTVVLFRIYKAARQILD